MSSTTWMVNGTVVSRADAGTATSADVHDVLGDVRWQSTTVTLSVYVDGLVTVRVGGNTIVCGADDGSSMSSTWCHVVTTIDLVLYCHYHVTSLVTFHLVYPHRCDYSTFHCVHLWWRSCCMRVSLVTLRVRIGQSG